MNSSTSGNHNADRGLRDPARLLMGALACGALAIAVIPFETELLRTCNVNLLLPVIGLWSWLDREAPRVLQTVAIAGAVVLLAFVAPSERRRRAGLSLLLGFVVVLGMTTALKKSVGRDRPLADPARGAWLTSPADLKDDRSFPSGHVSNATAICAAFWLAGRRGFARNLVWLVPPAMALSRLCLAVHWPTDVLGGAAIGLLGTSAVAFAAGFKPVDRALARLHPGGSRAARFALFAIAWLGVTRVWLELPVGRDPVSGEAHPGFSTRPYGSRSTAEFLFGPSLALALEDVRAIAVPLAVWAAVLLVAAGWWSRRLLIVTLALGAACVGFFFDVTPFGGAKKSGWALPDRFVAKDRRGVFADWHLHDGDPHDGGITSGAMSLRQQARRVEWAVTTHHSRVSDARPDSAGVYGSEWSGPLPAKGQPWRTAHLLLLGPKAAVEAGNAEATALGAARAASAAGALVIVAHLWRSQASAPGCPSFEDFAAAGAHGFEVGNRRRETDPAALARLRDLDRKCRERGLLRFSFSDDHGVPGGSPCVTFLEGVDEEELRGDGGLAVVEKLRAAAGRAGTAGTVAPIPLLFHPGDPTRFPPRWLAPPVMVFEYFRSLRMPQRASWLAAALLTGAWAFRPRRTRPAKTA